MLVSGATISLAALVGQGGFAALSCGAVTLVAAAGYYVLGGRDSDAGAAVGGRADERQLSAITVARAAAGMATQVCVAGYLVVAAAVGSPPWPAVVVGAAALLGAGAHLARGDRDLGLRSPGRPDERQAIHRVQTLAAAGDWSGMAALVGYATSLALGRGPWHFLVFILVGVAAFGITLAVGSAGGHAEG
jgi:hypothetical protein